MARTVALAACLIMAALIAWLGERAPSPEPARAPPGLFSAERAMADVRIVARAPHPMGSPDNAAVRDHLIRRMSALGLEPRVFAQPALYEARIGGRPLVIGGRPETVVGVLAGREPNAPAVALMAHYDSVPASPGAADDAAGVAAVLEAVRALKAAAPLRRDVVVVLTDGEEDGLLGARAFFAGHPQARRLGFVINLEARGGAGRARMFQTGAANGETIALFRRAVPSPSSSSLATFLFEVMPNDTDFTVAQAAGLQGLNFAFVGGQFDYHSASSTAANLDRSSLQDLGAQVLAAARAAAEAPALPRPAPDVVYNQLPGGYVAAYPAPAGWLALAVTAALLITAVAQARRKGRFAAPDALRGAGAGLFLLTAGGVLLRAARRAAGAGFGELEQRRLLAHAETFELALVLLGTGLMLYTAAELARGRRGVLWVPAAAGVVGGFIAGFDPWSLGLGAAAVVVGAFALRRQATIAGAWAGLLVTGFATACVVQAFVPLAAPVLAWPLLIASAAAALTCLWTWRPLWARGLVLIAAALALGWLGSFVHGIYLGLDAPELLAAPLWIAALVIWPLAQPDRKGAGTPFVSVGVLFAGLAVLAFVRFADPWSARRPEASQVAYLADRKAEKAYRLSLTPERTAWADAVLKADGGRVGARTAPPLLGVAVDAAEARAIEASAPQFIVAPAGDGRLILRVSAPPGASRLALDFAADAPLSAVTIAGRPSRLLAGPSRSGHLRWRGEARDLEIAFRPDGARALNLRYGVVTPGWPAAAKPLPPRPAEVMAYDVSDALFTTGEERLTWPAAWAKPLP